jgi:BolA protein
MMAAPGKAGSGSGETHFKVELVSAAFEGKSLVQRQRMVYQVR